MIDLNTFIETGNDLYEKYGGRSFLVVNPTEHVHLNAFKFPLTYVAGLCFDPDAYFKLEKTQTIYSLTLNEMTETSPKLWDFVVYKKEDENIIRCNFIEWAKRVRIGIAVVEELNYEIILNEGESEDADGSDEGTS